MVCGAHAQITFYDKDDKSIKSYCRSCNNKIMAERHGLENPEYPQEITVKPNKGKQRRFSVEYLIFDGFHALSAYEIGPTQYQCEVTDDYERPFKDMWDELIRRLKKQISVKYVKKDGSLGDGHKAVGYLMYNDEIDDLAYIVDGIPYPWKEFIGRHIDNHEGWQLKIEFVPTSVEIE
jgi:hypothetical protein